MIMPILFTPGLAPESLRSTIRAALPGPWAFHGARAPIARPATPLIACGFSAGGAMLRDCVLDRLEIHDDDAIVIADGIHIREPAIPGGSPMPRAPWQRLLDRARRGEGPRVLVSHTYLIYTDTMRDDPRTPAIERPYGSTATSLRMLTGWELEEPRERRGVVERTEGRLTVWSHESGDADAGAHGRQLTEHLPEMLRRLAAERASVTPSATETRPADAEAPTWRDPSLTLGQRLLAWCGTELSRGVRESGGPNRGPRVDWYFQAAPFERGGRPLRISGAPWCAAAVCAGVWSCLLPGEAPPVVARVSGLELERDARSAGRWSPGTEQGRPGDIAILPRSGSDPKRASWERHVVVVVSDDGTRLVTVGGNEGDTWRRTERAERPIGFVRV